MRPEESVDARGLEPEEKPLEPDILEEEEEEEDAVALEEAGALQAFLQDRRKVVTGFVVLVALIVAIYVLLPKVAGLGDTVDRVGDAKWYWVAVAIGFNVASFAAYAGLFRGILGGVGDDEVRRRLDLRASLEITLAAFAATLLFSAAGAGGLVLTYWALRKAGLPRRRSACRMVAFLTLQYAVYLTGLILFGVLLRTGVLAGDAPLAGTVIPAVLAGTAIVFFLLVALIPEDVERRLEHFAKGYRRGRLVRRLGSVPATVSTGVRTAIAYVRDPRRGAPAIGAAVAYWAANIGVLWASFKAFGVQVPFGVLAQGFFLGMAANLIPSAAGGVGSVDAGMIGAFVLFGIPSQDVFPAVLTFRAIFFWLPIAPGVVGYLQLRKTVARWERERRASRRPDVYTSESKVRAAEAT